MTTQTNRKVVALNVAVAAIREWQRGAIPYAEAARLADLTSEQWRRVGVWLTRTTPEAEVARMVAEAIGL